MIGTSLNQYRITASIGAGGMGEVFRARDTRLNRDVAVKVLPKDFAADADRLRRFEQEAIALANDTEYGLVAAQLKTGIVHINDQTINHEVPHRRDGCVWKRRPLRRPLDHGRI